jgi:hypothetical protein
MDFFSILVAIFACQNGVLIGILSAEYGLFTSLSTSDTNGTEVSQRFLHTLALKNTFFFLLYFVMLFFCVRPVVTVLVDFIISCC